MASNKQLAARLVRLPKILNAMADGRAVTAMALAKALGATERTIHRDIKLLQADGVRIVGERGVGYLIRRKTRMVALDG